MAFPPVPRRSVVIAVSAFDVRARDYYRSVGPSYESSSGDSRPEGDDQATAGIVLPPPHSRTRTRRRRLVGNLDTEVFSGR